MANGCGCLAVGGGQAEARLLEPLVEALRFRGWDAQLCELDEPRRGAPLDAARDAYVRLAERCGGAAVVGLGAGAAVALLLAEQYPAETLTLVAPERGAQRGARALARLAERNLFAVVAPTLLVASLGGTSGVRRLLGGLSAREAHVLWTYGDCPLGVPGEASRRVIEAIVEHIRHGFD
ncbi:MAG: hypothetical protein VB067_03220, partial [Christensenellaceae bacterium]|nr:hypothetical protein [Christensenellaceae bacterium]